MQVKACRPYHSRTVGRTLVRMPDGLSVFKVYFISIIGRDDPSRYEWSRGPMTTDSFVSDLRHVPVEGVGFITAFPHIAKIFRFAPSMETVLHVRAYATPELTPLNLGRDDNFVEFACYAEAAIAADEYAAWARARTVEDYLAYSSPFDEGPVTNPAKLAAYAKR